MAQPKISYITLTIKLEHDGSSTNQELLEGLVEALEDNAEDFLDFGNDFGVHVTKVVKQSVE